MNNWDRNNLDFLMSLTEEEFDKFMATMPDDDIQYAIELLQTRRAENLVELEELRDIVYEEDGMDLSDAQTVLARFRL
jgi:hypothetical protein